jgi:hypothetical protein
LAVGFGVIVASGFSAVGSSAASGFSVASGGSVFAGSSVGTGFSVGSVVAWPVSPSPLALSSPLPGSSTPADRCHR